MSPAEMAVINTTERLASLRKLMKERAIDMYSAQPPRNLLLPYTNLRAT